MVKTAVRCQDQTILEQYGPKKKTPVERDKDILQLRDNLCSHFFWLSFVTRESTVFGWTETLCFSIRLGMGRLYRLYFTKIKSPENVLKIQQEFAEPQTTTVNSQVSQTHLNVKSD